MRVWSFRLALLLTAAGLAPAQELGGCWLRDATTPDRSTIYLLCENGIVLKSGDAGSWETVRVPAEGRLRAIHFADSRRGFVAGDSGALLATQDGGKSWNRIDTGEREHFTDVRSLGAEVWVAGYKGTIMHSRDWGQSWQRQSTFASDPIESIYFASPTHGWAVGWWGLILRTTDGGTTWQQVRVPGVWETLSSVYFQDSRNGWAVGMYGLVLRSRDGGATWERQPAPVKGWLNSIVFAPDGTGWIAAEYDLLRSDDGGESWNVVPLETSMAVTRLVATRDSLLALGPGVALARSRDGNAWLKLEVDQLMAGSSRTTSRARAARDSS